MGESNFKGPWRVGFSDGSGIARGRTEYTSITTLDEGDDGLPTVICQIPRDTDGVEHLIAAAPELYEIGQHLLNIFDHPTDSVTILDADRLRAILAKARGES